ncbi:MAG: SDR family oxidoreductase [Ruminococcaceae bacterium]|nr:SDR family oxidoreductase [Oscillospiraceae bacterium]
MTELKGKVVIITGGGRGIGFGLSTAFAKAGADLVITGRTESTLLAAKENLERDYGCRVLAVTADGADEAAIKNVIDQAVATFGRIDAVINNAQASASGKMLIDHTREDLDLAIYSGIYATFFYMREAFPYLKKTGGCVINFASGAGLFGRIAQSSYAAAKEGIRGLSRVAATEWAPDGVRVNVICPLAMTEGLKKFKEEYPERYEQTIKGVPMGRFADPEKDVGRVCVFLCSDEASYITGETITLQGGSGLRP